MFKTLLIAGWVVFAADVFLAAAFLRDSRSQDAAGRGMAYGIGLVGLIALGILVVPLLYSARSHSWWLLGGSVLALSAPFLIYLSSGIERTIRQAGYLAVRSKPGDYSDPAQTAAAKAITAGDVDALRAILAGHPNLKGRDSAGYDLLSYAVSRVFEGSTGDASVRISAVQLLLEAGMDGNGGRYPDGDGILAALVGKLPEPAASRLLNLFLEHGADPNVHANNAPILFGLGKSPQLAAAFLDHGAAPEARDSDGNTPLLYFVMHYQWDGALLLLARGADAGATNDKGETLDSLLHDQELSSQQMQQSPDQGHAEFKAALDRRRQVQRK
jgi:hypothetical protein